MFKILSGALVALTLAGCAVTVPPGASREEAIARHGRPSAVVALPGGGSRLQYAVQPEGKTAWMVDLDASGRVVETRQMLSPSGFTRVVPGRWTRQDAYNEFGPPATIDHVYSWTGDILTYRWMDFSQQPMLFWIYLDPNNVVQKTGQGMDFRRIIDPF
ncbi:MAG: hypothetical protein Q7T87_03445 [Polaromonas sp.]|nr:hypothetical protein [Polaromonas sp.]